MLALAEVEHGHDGSLLVLGRVALEDLGDELLILGVELEGQVGVVVGCVSVLGADSMSANFWTFCVSMDEPALSLSEGTQRNCNGGLQRTNGGPESFEVFGARLYHLEGVAGPAGCDGKGAGLRADDARGAAEAGAEEEGCDFARHCAVGGGRLLLVPGRWLEVGSFEL